MRIAVGGMKKTEMEAAIRAAAPDAEITVTNDMTGAQLIKQGKVDYYFGACESGGGAAISILIGLVGYTKCCTVCKNGGAPDPEQIKKFVDEGKVVFGMNLDSIERTVPILIEALKNK
ncbi:MAG TPA: DUF2620 domain-containing protein [Candidatus Olsenella pullistercoris]|uniref:DUF2620 domain-containing protein n=1 Tax=Candidatus Olsenella pullistercoris TaxID=2838712 RepID=A0A9D2EY36_9ACTN|nr:DUF2620 domain-containing protein [Candidatus Olsenella pullistercoris]